MIELVENNQEDEGFSLEWPESERRISVSGASDTDDTDAESVEVRIEGDMSHEMNVSFQEVWSELSSSVGTPISLVPLPPLVLKLGFFSDEEKQEELEKAPADVKPTHSCCSIM